MKNFNIIKKVKLIIINWGVGASLFFLILIAFDNDINFVDAFYSILIAFGIVTAVAFSLDYYKKFRDRYKKK